jgi:hypothetical protein
MLQLRGWVLQVLSCAQLAVLLPPYALFEA